MCPENPYALHDAVSDVDEPLVARLLAEGSDPNLADDEAGMTPLDYVLMRSYELHFSKRAALLNIVDALMQHGADPFHKDFLGHSAYDWAVKFRDADLVKRLSVHQQDQAHHSQTEAGLTNACTERKSSRFVAALRERLSALHRFCSRR